MVNDTTIINRFIAFKNPFRYRSYYHDFETNLYYLNSRYYDPEIGRFINADDIASLNISQIAQNGLNLYAYCLNNPMNQIDENGDLPKWLRKLLGWLLVAVIAVASIVSVGAVAFGAVAAGSLLGSVMLGGGIGALTSMAGSIIAQGGFSKADPFKVAMAGGIGAAIGVVTGAASWGIGTIGRSLGQQLGFVLSNTTHLSSGIKFGKVFGYTLLVKIGGIVGNVVGGIIGGTVSNYFANKIFGKDLNFEQTMKEGILGELPSWLINMFRWMVA